jgi:hypothetical protein
VKRPAFQFYPKDWRDEQSLRLCSMAARGLWIDLMCLMHSSERYGHLELAGKPMTAEQLARLVGESAKDVKRWMAELTDNGVCSTTPEGVLFSRRMVRDEDIRNRRAEGGAAGAEHGVKGAAHGRKGGRPTKETGGEKPPFHDQEEPPLQPPPSSASAFASASALQKQRDKRAFSVERPESVPEKVWTDFLAVRKAKRAPLTATALEGIVREAEKAAMPLADVLTMCCERGWQAFRSEWLTGIGGAAKPIDMARLVAELEAEEEARAPH